MDSNIGDGKGLVRLMLNIIFTAHKYIDIIKLKYTFVHIIKWKIRTKRRTA